MLAPSLSVDPPRFRSATKALQQARDQLRKDKLLEVLLTYADTIEQMDAIRAHVRGLRTVDQYLATLTKGLREGAWPWVSR